MKTDHPFPTILFWSICLAFALLANYGRRKKKKWSRSTVVILHLLLFGTLVMTVVLSGWGRPAPPG
jgi:hypothetical protein